MRQILELSIFQFGIRFISSAKMKARAFAILLSTLLCGNLLEARTQIVKPMPAKSAVVQTQKSTLPPLLFLEQAEDIEREAWWIITNKRIDGVGSPFRVFRAVSLQSVAPGATAQKSASSKINFKFCKSLLVFEQGPNQWRIESACQKPSAEIGVLQKLASQPDRWKISWKTQAFSDHFGLSTAILFNQQSCEIDLDAKGRISRMSCPHYVRDRKVSEIVEFNIFEFKNQAPKILKLDGDVKKELQVIATFNTEVPLSGDIVLNVKKVPQKAVEEKTEFSNMSQPVPTRGDSHGQKANEKSKDSSKAYEKNDEGKNQISEQKSRSGQQKADEESDRSKEGYESQEVGKKTSGENGTESDPRFNENRDQENGPRSSYQNDNNGSTEESHSEHGTNEVPAIDPSPTVPAPTR